MNHPVATMPTAPLATAEEADLPAAPLVAWRTGMPIPAAWPVPGPHLTLAVRVTLPAEAAGLLAWQSDDGVATVRLAFGGRDGELAFELNLAADRAALRLGLPARVLGAAQAHELVLRHCGHRIDLLVDGVVVDAEWPLDHVPILPGAPRCAAGCVDRLALWDRFLSDGEVMALCGPLAVAPEAIFGPAQPPGQYWRPQGFNVHVGDAMPCTAEGRFRVYYLLDRRNHRSMWTFGGHEWAQVSTTDLRHWEEHPLALRIDGQPHGSLCTGAVLWHDGVCHAFYTVRVPDRTAAPLCRATSADGVNFTKAPPLLTLTAPYAPPPARDPVVFHSPADGRFHLLVTTALADEAGRETCGCLAHLTSADLAHWTQQEPFLVLDRIDHPECPDYFERGGWHYLLFGIRGVTHYRMSRALFGPWVAPPNDVLDGPHARVMKTAPFGGDRRLGAAFVPDGGYGGDLLVRDLVFHADGTLGTAWTPEMIPAVEALRADELALTGSVALPASGRWLMETRFEPRGGSDFGVRLEAAEGVAPVEVRFEPSTRRVVVSPVMSSDVSVGEIALEHVAGLDAPFTLRLLVRDDLLDLDLGNGRTFVARIATAGWVRLVQRRRVTD